MLPVAAQGRAGLSDVANGAYVPRIGQGVERDPGTLTVGIIAYECRQLTAQPQGNLGARDAAEIPGEFPRRHASSRFVQA